MTGFASLTGFRSALSKLVENVVSALVLGSDLVSTTLTFSRGNPEPATPRSRTPLVAVSFEPLL